ncbi:hypothetical protein ACVXHB_29810 [Escherichia coli]
MLMETRRLISACRINKLYKIYYLLKAVLTSKEEQAIHQFGGAGVYGENFTLNNNGSVWGGDGYNGGIAVSGNKISINNYRNVYGGNGLGGSGSSGGAGLSGDDIIVDNYRSIYGGDDVGGTGGSGVTGSNITVHNSGGILGGNGVNGGDGINGSNLFITNDNMISGGYGIKQGGDAISGNQITLNNNGIVQGHGPTVVALFMEKISILIIMVIFQDYIIAKKMLIIHQ